MKTKIQKTFEAIVVIIGTVLFIGWLWIMFSTSGGSYQGERSPVDCFTASGDAC
ncbi:MAG: hypothetical protein U1C49_00695 [Candidatus Andersenbacteria bacterium]|nr:hypothetical protein [Candidatus Andersenbacteria bacterium]